MTRDKRTVKFTKPIVSDEEGLRLATPEIVAKYIAKRLKTDIIADLGCGIGGQVIFFAKECKKVYAVERDPKKLEYAEKNCETYNVKNVEFILGDALSESTKAQVSDADIIFSDPARPLAEKERTLENLEPPITGILKLYSDITERFAFHAPPQMPPARITLDCEREYLSLNGQLNRLTLYFDDLKRCERSAVVLPGESHLCSSDAPSIKTGHLREYVYEPQPSVVKAELLNELAQTTAGDQVFYYKGDERRTLLTSSKPIDSPFFKDSYRVVGRTERDIHKMRELFRKEKAGKVVLRFDVEPERYWDIRKKLEEGSRGERVLHVFGFGDEVVVCEKM
ncbi:RNA cap guanine-N2 methyltransferase [Candidatus Methanoperedens nitroreducens]|uniref:RNA cap guanine-N2 methyltransferase n=1 Tax=Candidatus Methanoperedens nitratireducens TaxID=1392998 RepID=A0A062V5C3_9EURY|nr:methyltransferase domain-containing protein [Candidatus Methanoperedens nitroreducens]KCZ72512.1 RNA cap guanine-N2 methyltransferase [Candidatus Methanoperedens nitroreducens]MDJ1423554.1 methyltransferase domain-containing protein [Candidatus Methanoperedens sp.]